MVRAGTFAWLVAHDLRLNWRRFTDLFGGAAPGRALALATACGLGLHAMAWPAVSRLADHLPGNDAAGSADPVLLAGLLVCVASWMMAQGLFLTTRTLYDRGDLDLLFSSPQSPRRVLAAKATAIALSSLGSVAMLALPIANVGAWRLGPHWLAIYPTLAGVALLATAAALAATIALFHVVGPRRARLYANLTGAGIGGAFVLAIQIVAMLPAHMRAAIQSALAQAPPAERGLLGNIGWLPIQSLLGDPVAMIGLFGFGIAVFAVVAIWLGPSFARASMDAAGAPGSATLVRGKGKAQAARFRNSPAAALRRKEWRLLLRDPNLFAQLSLQIVYTIPLAVVLVNSGKLPIALALAPAIIVITAQVAASLAWIAVSGEDAPELIASAPVRPRAVDLAKLSAIAGPVCLIAAVPLACLALAAPREAAIASFFAAAGAASTALLNLWHPMPGNRRGMLRRHAQSKLIGLLEHLLAILWAIGSVLALLGTGLWLIPAVLALVVVGHDKIPRLWKRKSQPPATPNEALARLATEAQRTGR